MTTPAMLGIGIGVAVAVAAGGTAYVAKDAEPGDMLYNVRASLYGDVTTDVDAETSMEGARNAYDEAKRMQADGTLTAEERARLTADYSTHVNAMAAGIARLEAEGDAQAAAEARTNLRDTLRSFRDVFPTVTVDVEGDASASMDADTDADASSSAASGTGDSVMDDDSSSSDGMSSSIFRQPSSAVTSA